MLIVLYLRPVFLNDSREGGLPHVQDPLTVALLVRKIFVDRAAESLLHLAERGLHGM